MANLWTSRRNPHVLSIGATSTGWWDGTSRHYPAEAANHSVEMLGSAWTLCGMTIRKFEVASSARPSIRSASAS